jgi:flagellar biosynthesis GTPase FlhF
MTPEIHTFRARSLAEALQLVRHQLGPDAALLETRQAGSALLRLVGGQAVEVTASADIDVPSRLPGNFAAEPRHVRRMPSAELENFRQQIRLNLETAGRFEKSLVERLALAQRPTQKPDPNSSN